MTTEDGNKLIAEFIGKPVTEDNNLYMSSEIDYTFPVHLKYHSSWDWLMPVVEKIQSLSCNVNIINNCCQIIMFDTSYSGEPIYKKNKTMANTKIENVYDSVIQFIQWYNQQQKTK